VSDKDANDLLGKLTRELSSDPYNLNFYKILGLPSKEVIHSKFIKFLLNPNEKNGHGYHDAFLKLFIDMLKEKIGQKKNVAEIPSYKDYKSAKVTPEAPTNKGRFIDILIEIKGHFIIIENKIHAIDQNRQLRDYNKYIIKKYNKKPTLVYLTLYGKKASRKSLRKEVKEEAEKKYNLCHQDYIQLSYEKDIIGWIKSSINFIINNNPGDTKMLFLLTEYFEMLERIFNRYKIIMLLLEEEKTFKNVFEKCKDVINILLKNMIKNQP
jgi:hypothetical protein